MLLFCICAGQLDDDNPSTIVGPGFAFLCAGKSAAAADDDDDDDDDVLCVAVTFYCKLPRRQPTWCSLMTPSQHCDVMLSFYLCISPVPQLLLLLLLLLCWLTSFAAGCQGGERHGAG
jgi:hypothetical protein